MRAPIDSQTTTPMFGARPPYHGSREAKQRKADSADPVDEAAGRSHQQVLVETDDPLDKGVTRQVVTIDNHAARNAHQKNVRTRRRPHPEMNLEEDIAHPRFIRSLKPLLPGSHLPFLEVPHVGTKHRFVVNLNALGLDVRCRRLDRDQWKTHAWILHLTVAARPHFILLRCRCGIWIVLVRDVESDKRREGETGTSYLQKTNLPSTYKAVAAQGQRVHQTGPECMPTTKITWTIIPAGIKRLRLENHSSSSSNFGQKDL